MAPGEAFCLGCRSAVVPLNVAPGLAALSEHDSMTIGTCPNGGSRVSKLRSATGRDGTGRDSTVMGSRPNTSPDREDEAEGSEQACIGKGACPIPPEIHFTNDRILFHWQIYAGRYDPKTMDAHLTAIREFERFIGGTGFERVTAEDISRYRNDLIDRSKRPTCNGGLRRSTVRHRASHLKAFFSWFCSQPGIGRINRSLPDYFHLPKGAVAFDLEPEPKHYPTFEEATLMVSGMPTGAIIDRRDRAIVAWAFVFGLRAAALITLRGEHLKRNEWSLDHDGRSLRAKNGKSFRVFAFPRTDPFRDVIEAWVSERHELGLGDCDALLPSKRDLRLVKNGNRDMSKIIEPMKTSGAVTAAFRSASSTIGCSFTPHSARHCLANLGRTLCRTPREGRIWSANLGHDSDQITDRHYATVTEIERRQFIREMGAPQTFTDDEKDLMLDYHQHALSPGTQAFEMARVLVRRREDTV